MDEYYHEMLNRMESNLTTISVPTAVTSIAISLKRLADQVNDHPPNDDLRVAIAALCRVYTMNNDKHPLGFIMRGQLIGLNAADVDYDVLHEAWRILREFGKLNE